MKQYFKFKLSFLAFLLITVLSLSGCASNQSTSATADDSSKTTVNEDDSKENPATEVETTNVSTENTSEVDTSASEAETSDTDKGELPVITVRAAFASGMTGVINQYAIANGLYEKEGIVFDLVLSDNFVSAFASGDIDFADTDPGTFAQAAANGVPLKMVGNMWRSRGAYWIVANNDIDSIEDLKGKVVGTASTSGGMRITTMEVLKLAGLDPNKDVELVANGVNRNAYATLVSGEVDATIIHQPFATIALQEGTGHPIAKTWEFVTDYYTGTLAASDDFIENRPEDLQRVITAYYKVHEEVKANLDEFYPWAAEFLGIDEATARTAIEAEIELWTDEPVIDPARLQKTVDMLVEYGFLRDEVTIDDTYDNTFAEVAAKELGLN